MSEYVVWGFNHTYMPEPIKLDGGNLGKCNAEVQRRKAEGWTCAIYKVGTPPTGLREQAAGVREWREHVASQCGCEEAT